MIRSLSFFLLEGMMHLMHLFYKEECSSNGSCMKSNASDFVSEFKSTMMIFVMI
ncbi:MAG: hypothetical protein K2F64_00975 [Muribaculaceae bacterium]|nr:hypothetical protein [Muribaculaceae bacterium]